MENLRTMIATTVIGKGYVSCIVIHIANHQLEDASTLSGHNDRINPPRANSLKFTPEET
jgi:hypothetical protein